MNLWKDVEGFEDYFEVCEDGRVRSKERFVYRSVGAPFLKKAKVLTNKGKRYVSHNFSINGVSNYKTGHRLVAEAFIPNPLKLPMVLHKDNNKLNNHKDNLEWGDGFKNMQDAVTTGAVVALKGIETYGAKSSEAQIIEIRRLYGTGNYSMAEIGEMYNYPYRSISDIVRGKSWKHLPGIIPK